ncbi:MAG TPA: hypothetical protein VEH75_06925, partial [Xanthobacteraceae bacterium]|nr:hypothetical protein [Xanthobacteraceae bacterium]
MRYGGDDLLHRSIADGRRLDILARCQEGKKVEGLKHETEASSPHSRQVPILYAAAQYSANERRMMRSRGGGAKPCQF